MNPNNSPSLRDKRLRAEPSDDVSLLMDRRTQRARLSNAIQKRAVESGRQRPRTMSPTMVAMLSSAAAAGGPTVKTSMAESLSSSEEEASDALAELQILEA